MNAQAAPAISTGLNTQSPWSPAQEKRIQEILEQRGCTRGNAVRVMRAEEARLKVVDPLAKATVVPAETIPETQLRPVKSSKKAKAPVKKADKKERKAGLTYDERKAAGICTKCAAYKIGKDEATCAVCKAMAHHYLAAKKDGRNWSRENFFATVAAKEAIAASKPV